MKTVGFQRALWRESLYPDNIKSKVHEVYKVRSMDHREKIEIILKIVIVFLSALLVLSIFNNGVTPFMVVGALGVTYIFIHYWQKRIITLQQKKMQVK